MTLVSRNVIESRSYRHAEREHRSGNSVLRHCSIKLSPYTLSPMLLRWGTDDHEESAWSGPRNGYAFKKQKYVPILHLP